MLKKTSGFLRQRRGLIFILLGCALLGWGGFSWLNKPASNKQLFVTQAAKRGDLSVTVTATGTLQPTNKVDISSELSGTAAKVYVDYNDQVKKGQLLLELDTTKLQQTIDGARATLQSREAAVTQAKATLKETEISLTRMEEVSRLSGGKVPAATELDAARAKVERARADLASANAAVAQALATLRSNETDLTKARIRSPINGVVLARSIDPGQTVAASLSAPTLFSLAEDLTQMELIVLVSEADISQVHEGQKVQFTVDAFAGKTYPATVRLVRLGSKTVDNVVSYQTVLTVKNPNLTLLPGMTANADILVNEKKDVLLVPNAALRFKPAPAASSESSGGVMSFLLPRPPGANRAPARATQKASRTAATEGDEAQSAISSAASRPSGRASQTDGRRTGNVSMPAEATRGMSRGQVWIKDAQGLPHAVPVLIGASDGKFTEIRSRDLKAGDEVITGTQMAGKP